MGHFCYSLTRTIGRLIAFQTMRVTVLHGERLEQPGGFVVACTHLSHLEPFVVSGLMRRKVDWMARIEFYKNRICGAMLNAVNAFPVNRRGVPVKAIRTAISRAAAGKIIGIFPEGGVVHGDESVLRRGPIKLGACAIALHANVPILPVVVLGTRQLTRVGPWIPWRRARLWIIVGPPIQPPTEFSSRRTARLQLGEELLAAFRSAYDELKTAHTIPEQHQP